MAGVLIVSSLPTVRAGLRSLLAAGGFEVVGEASGTPEADALLADRRSEVVVIDAGPDLAAEDVAALAGVEDGPGLVLLGPLADDERLGAALGQRAWGYLPRQADGDQVLAAVRAVASGLSVFDPELAARLRRTVHPAGPTPADSTDDELTAREREVLQLVALGLPNKSIARRLAISEHTVKFHVAAILAKLGAGSRTEAVHLGARRGLVAL